MFRSGGADDALLDAAVRAGGVRLSVVFARRGGVDLLPAGVSQSSVLAGFGVGSFGTAPFGGAMVVQVPGSVGGVRLLSGSVTDRPGDGGVRRTLELEVEDATSELFDVLAPSGTTLHPFSVVVLTDGHRIEVPHGVFDVDVQKAGVGPSGGLSLTAPDKYARIQRARLLRPYQSRAGVAATQQIAELVQHGLGANEPVLNYSRSRVKVPNVVWDNRAGAIEELAKSAGVHVGFDRLGRCCIVDLPTLSAESVWSVDASSSGVLLGGARERHRRNTANVVRVTSDVADAYGPPFRSVVVWDSDPDSPTYAGPDPVNRPDLAGPFGVVPFRYSSPLITDGGAAEVAARTILARVTGLSSQTQVTAVHHPALDAFDVIDVVPPRRRPEDAAVIEKHVADAVVHPLVGAVQSIEGRSTRADPYTLT